MARLTACFIRALQRRFFPAVMARQTRLFLSTPPAASPVATTALEAVVADVAKPAAAAGAASARLDLSIEPASGHVGQRSDSADGGAGHAAGALDATFSVCAGADSEMYSRIL